MTTDRDDARDPIDASALRASEQASEQGRFAAREFLARMIRETGETPSAVVVDRVLFAYEMGYLRGRSDAMREMSQMFDDLPESGRRGEDDDAAK